MTADSSTTRNARTTAEAEVAQIKADLVSGLLAGEDFDRRFQPAFPG